MYCRKHWRRVQHLSNEFWSRWRKEVLLTLQNRQKWNNKTRNCEIGDIVLVKDDMERNRWSMSKVVATYKDYKGVARSVMGSVDRVSQKSRYLERPVNKLVVLVENKDEFEKLEYKCFQDGRILRGAICKRTIDTLRLKGHL